jgi:hypothetical protein
VGIDGRPDASLVGTLVAVLAGSLSLSYSGAYAKGKRTQMATGIMMAQKAITTKRKISR